MQEILERKKIEVELNNLFDYPLTIVVAAMGYGKTTAVKSFLHSRTADCIWVSVESDETPPQYLWDSFTRQISKTRTELGDQLRAHGFPADAVQRSKIEQILEEHLYRTDTVLVIDDYYFAHSPVLDRFVTSLIKASIEGLHVLILSRTLPNIGVDELMLKGYCYLIKNTVFELSSSDIMEYFRLNGYALDEDTARSVYELSEGWITAVYLMMQRYAETGRLETGRSLERLIDTAVMPRYSDREIRILKSLCIFDSFTPRQAVYVTRDEGAASMIDNLSLSNSFIRFDDNSGSYKIHNIFNNYLRNLLESQPGDIETETLYERYGTWCLQNGDILSGMKFLLKGKKFDLFLSAFKNSRTTKTIDSNPGLILDYFAQIPAEELFRHPIGFISYIGFFVTNVDREAGELLLSEVEKYYRNKTDMSPSLWARISGEIELIRGYIAINDVSQMLDRFKAAHQLLDGRSHIANKDKIITFGSPHILYLYYREKGRLLWTLERLEEVYPYYGELSGGCGAGLEYQIRAEYYLAIGDLDRAERFAYKAVYKARTLDQLSVISCANFTLARVCTARGQFDEALDMMDTLNVELQACGSTILSSTQDLCIGYIQGIRGEENGFANWLKNGDMMQSEVLYQGMGFNYIVYGKYLLIKENYIKTEVLCEEMRKIFSPFNNMLGMLHSYVLEAVAKYKLYGMKEAESMILQALDIGRADGIVTPFAEYGSDIAEILNGMLKSYGEDTYLRKLVCSAQKYAENQKSRKMKSTARILSNREDEILQLLADGKTNREIASTLFIAEVTVRKTITSMYRKLDVSGRAAAVKKGIELELVNLQQEK